MAGKKKKKGNGIIFGLAMLWFSIGGIWKNEHRFDYFKAARDTVAVESVDGLSADTLFSHTGTMDQSLQLKGQYVRLFEGYLEVKMIAEIYAWDRDEDDDGVTWSKKWMSNLQRNDRNKGLKKQFNSNTFAPVNYRISELSVRRKDIQFVDPRQEIPPSELILTKRGENQGLVPESEYFYLAKGRAGEGSRGESEQLGDERVSYRGRPVPEVATYFGKWGEGKGVAHKVEVDDGFVSGIIQDKGILHHLVAGSRETALVTVQEHLARLKLIVRIVGVVLCTIGGGILFTSLTRFLVFIPIIGPSINQITGWLGMLIGFLLGVITLGLAYLTSKPLILAALLVVFIGAMYFLWKNAAKKRQRIQANVAESLGHTPSESELKELEFIQLWQLANSNGSIEKEEQSRLDQLTAKNGWSPDKVAELTNRAWQERAHTNDSEKLEALIRYSLADGKIDSKELKSLESAAGWIGMGKKDLRSMMSQIQAV
ncbi:MAG: TMEM43 family protein [Luteolibacter sp.]